MKVPIFLWLLLISVGAHFLAVSGQCLEDQRSLLLQFKNSLQLNPSGKLAGWNQSADCCLWSGVTCDLVGLVIGLDLTNESISAGIGNTSGLFNLQNLQSLNLSENKFISTIPGGLDRLTSLKFLNLSNAGFRGQVPIEISRMTRLVSLDLSTNNYLNGIPPLQLENPNLAMLVGNLSELMELYLDGVNISANGNEWCHALSSSLPKLRVLSMSNCYLSGPIDSSLLKIRSLSVIHLDNNNLSSVVPDFFADFWNLTSLRLGTSGSYGEFPKRIFQVSTLQTIDLSNNKQLQGSLPEFPKDGSLQTIKLSETNFSGMLPDSIGNLKFLSRIELGGCKFNGSIPKSMANLTQLVYLDFSSNELDGSIPSFALSKNLTQIILAHNGFLGQIPPDWKGLQNLVNLDLGNNSLSGSIPEFLISLPSLQKIQLNNNQFSGQFHVSNVSSSHQLDTLDLSSNKLAGLLPISLFELRGLKFLSLSSNNFSGSLNLDVIRQLVNLSYIDLSHNSLSVDSNGADSTLLFPNITTLKLAYCKLRTFPEFLRNQSTLRHLDLSGNQIQGNIPNWIWNIGLYHLNLSFNFLLHLEAPIPGNSSLIVLDLHSNHLQGPIPILPKAATYLDYSSNNLSSPIPSEIGAYLSFAIFLSLSSNKFHGVIPVSVCNASYLQVLDLSNNSLSGEIPKCLMAMSGVLGVMNLRKNHLSGMVDDNFPIGCNLKTLDLSENRLEGKVPRSLANCKLLEVLNFGKNLMHDVFPCHLKNKTTSLRVLVLRSNHFYGQIGCPDINGTWQMLQIVDLASNNFTGKLPGQRFTTWKAMMLDEDSIASELNHVQFEFLELSNLYYQDAVTVTSKGLEMELVKILTVFTSIDFSCNKLEGPIPEELGYFKALYVLNLSHNGLTGEMPSIWGNLSQLESLDLSVNKLIGTIPPQLAQLNFLSFLNLSYNLLVGKIPISTQLQSFPESSFQGNEGLCGAPLNVKCTDPTNPPAARMDSEEDSGTKFDWQFIYTGLGFGVGSAVAVAPLMFWRRGRRWSDDFVDQILLALLPMVGLKYTIWHDREDEDEEDTEEEDSSDNNDNYDDDDDDDARVYEENKVESKQFQGKYCVFCTKLDLGRKRAIHNPKCTCHNSPPISIFSSFSRSSFSS